MKKQEVLTPEQKKAREEAIKAAKAAGKDKKACMEAGEAAAKMTDEQKAKLSDIKKEMGACRKDLKDKVLAVLTPEQQEQLKKAHQKKPK